MSKFNNLDKFNKIYIGVNNQINLIYENNNVIYHDYNCRDIINYNVVRIKYYSRRRLDPIVNSWRSSIIKFGIEIKKY